MGTFSGVAYSVTDYEDNLPIYVPGNLSNGNFSWVETHKCLDNGSLIAPVQINNITLTEASQVRHSTLNPASLVLTLAISLAFHIFKKIGTAVKEAGFRTATWTISSIDLESVPKFRPRFYLGMGFS